jgi:hypothetical protein
VIRPRAQAKIAAPTRPGVLVRAYDRARRASLAISCTILGTSELLAHCFFVEFGEVDMALDFVVAPPLFNPLGCTLTLTADDGSGPIQVIVDPDVLAFVAGTPVTTGDEAITALIDHIGRIKSAAGRALIRTKSKDRKVLVELCDLEEKPTAR